MSPPSIPGVLPPSNDGTITALRKAFTVVQAETPISHNNLLTWRETTIDVSVEQGRDAAVIAGVMVDLQRLASLLDAASVDPDNHTAMTELRQAIAIQVGGRLTRETVIRSSVARSRSSPSANLISADQKKTYD